MSKTFWTYAVDGSGVDLRAEVIVLGTEGTAARIFIAKPTFEVAQVLKYTGPTASPCWNTDGVTVTVPAASLSGDQYPAVASFGWLD
jgi:hypothetical protein